MGQHQSHVIAGQLVPLVNTLEVSRAVSCAGRHQYSTIRVASVVTQAMWPFGSSEEATRLPQVSSAASKAQEHDDLAELVRAFHGEDTESAPVSTKQIVAPTPAVGGIVPPLDERKHEALPDGRRVFADGTIDITPDEMHPRSMNCRQAFDQAFYCQSLGGKFNDIYRYGELKSCSEQWGAFWFCMRTRTLGEVEKARQTADYYQKRDARRKATHGSSEDVWEMRTRSVREAFGKDPDSFELQLTTKS